MKKESAIVVQMGARRNYAIPVALNNAGKLTALYTDICGVQGVGKYAQAASFLPLGSGLKNALSRLSRRQPPDQIAKLTNTFDYVSLKYEVAKHLSKSRKDLLDARLQFDIAWGERMIRRGFSGASHIYTMMSGITLEGGDFIERAFDKKLRIVVDMTIALSAERIIADLYKSNQGWGAAPLTYLDVYGFDNPYYRKTVQLADKFLCASPYVARDLVENWNVDASKVIIEPYSFHPSWLNVVNKPVIGRILFPGSADLRKGIHIFARAASLIHKMGFKYEFRVVGNVNIEVMNNPECSMLSFIGRVSRENMYSEMASADVVVLPTLVEGSAGVTYEAMATGVPLITTAEAGSMVVDGLNGVIIESNCVDSVVKSILAVVENRKFRDALGREARKFMSNRSWMEYSGRLESAVFKEIG